MMSEHLEQKALIAWARAAANTGHAQAPDGRTLRLSDEQRDALALLHHARNGGMSKGENGRAKALGTVAGWPDLFLPYLRYNDECPVPGLFIEMKAKGGRVSPAQKDVMTRLESAGYAVAVCYGFDDARAAILDYFDLNPEPFA